MSSTNWALTAHHVIGLEATWRTRLFGDTRAVEIWGEVTNRGDAPRALVTDALTLDLELPLAATFDQPWVRIINGVRFLPTYFPPHDFAVVHRQLIDTPQAPGPLELLSAEAGWSSPRRCR
ncbi:MAG: hypothetical protein NZ483_10655 [Verrucomicrobiae bacterium]|nr:hypothetical protein [Verrucomicrobiae bacterium]MDW8345235.1 hypothetical protein [Verrucomicrobiae bacterium]